MMKKLNPRELPERMKKIPGWRRRGSLIWRVFEFKDFAVALKFVLRVGKKAEAAHHHPDIDVRWNKVRLALTTHDAGGLTAMDFEMAEACSRFAARAVG